MYFCGNKKGRRTGNTLPLKLNKFRMTKIVKKVKRIKNKFLIPVSVIVSGAFLTNFVQTSSWKTILGLIVLCFALYLIMDWIEGLARIRKKDKRTLMEAVNDVLDAKIASGVAKEVNSALDAKITSSVTKAFEEQQFSQYRKMNKETAAGQIICSHILKEHIKSIANDSKLKSELKRKLEYQYPHLGGEVEDLIERVFRFC